LKHDEPVLTPDDLLARIREQLGHPATVREIMRALKLPKVHAPAIRRSLRTLVSRGDLVETRGKHYGVPDFMDMVPGRITVNPGGFAFVRPERDVEGLTGDVYVAGTNLNEAMHGDRVLVRIDRHRHDGRAEGRIVRILERSAGTIVGRFDVDDRGLQFVVPFDRRMLMDVQVPAGDEQGAAAGAMVVIEITRWPTPARNALGRVVEVLGDINAPGVDTQIIIRKFGIPDRHSDEAITEASRLGSEVAQRDIEGRSDFRADPVVTIDGDDARDFDDAVYVEKLPGGRYRLAVHIADVAHYVREGSVLDHEAAERATSVYFPERAVHMFPHELATGLCSLRPDVDRLVQSCVMEIDGRGRVVDYSLHDGVIHSHARMTYNEVHGVLEGDADLRERYRELVPHFERMHELFEILNQRRRQRGSIDFDLPETELVLDDEGAIEDILMAERNVAHRIIEEFMLVANETVAEHLRRNDVPTLYRVHESPDPLKVEQFEEFISTLGYSLAAPASGVKPRHFQKLIDKLKGRPEQKPIATLMLRTMQKARYDPACLGHFGLAAEEYTHFTSPIRRYPDLIVHRTLREHRHGALTEDQIQDRIEELPEVARHSSDMERRADEAENELVAWKKVRFMADKVGEEFDGFITGVAPFGLFIELVEHYVEGLVHISSMADDYYRFVERAHLLSGENTRRTYRLGDKVRVQVVRVDQERRQVDLGIVEILDRVRASERNRGARSSRVKPKAEQKSRPTGKGKASRPGKRERAERKAAKRRS
jgi:ribonuclease R